MISIIIPTVNEEVKITELLNYLKSIPLIEKAEIIVCDAGSKDNTRSIAQGLGAKVVESKIASRSYQMNLGADYASGEILFFLHADSIPPFNVLSKISNALGNGFQCGCFRLKFDFDHPILNFYSWYTRFDFDIFRFGDQGLFVTKESFEKVGGFDTSLIVMEDQQIVRDLKKCNRFTVMDSEMLTSARKYRKVGLLKLQFIFLIIVSLYYLNIPQVVIVHFYKESLKI